jgi:antitoxin component YwqK of YwqJK toxin-antitoxin module
MRHVIIILLIFQTADLFGQIEVPPIPTDTLRNGIEEHFYENGQLRTSYTYRKGKLDGKMSKWYESGVKKIEGQFENDLPVDTFKAWYPNGQLMAEVPAVNGKLQEDTGRYWTMKGKQCNKQKAKRLAEKIDF